ncbi:hypothetical protein NQ117_10975 [Paenibacillus sp. SC116]|uniref:phage baseplate plug family protein n=1 Tax=Paenibacillus sp. SC116 TaxID=2968986 RepID=UPI00215A4927|nr:hypothetical protein [Paenibacillus sp. SC116]MCR8844208.1 hypothetical protein [Paenibacillus sp. SC116]
MAILTIEKERLPYSFDMDMGTRTYTFDVRYNNKHDYFTMDISQGGTPLALGVKLVWGVPLFESMETTDFPLESIVPYGSDPEELVSWETLGNSVFLNVGDENAVIV